MNVTEKTTYVDEAKALLLNQDKEKPFLEALLSAAIESIQTLETKAFEMYLSRMIDNATNAQLNIIGAIVLQPRYTGDDDDTYRRYIKARIAINRSNGKIPELLIILSILSVNGESYRIRDKPPASMVLEFMHQITDKPKLSFDDAVFSRDSDSYLLVDGALSGPYSTGVKAISISRGRNVIQIKRGRSTYIDHSEVLSTSIPPSVGISIIDDDIESPLGTVTADFAKEDTSTGGHNLYRSYVLVDSIGYNVLPIYAKENGRHKFAIIIYNESLDLLTLVNIDLKSHTISEGNYILPIDDGFCLCIIPFITDTLVIRPAIYLLDDDGQTPYTGDGVSGIHFWGVNVTKSLTSYIKAVDLPASEESDVLYWGSVDIPEWLNDRFSVDIISNYTNDILAASNETKCLAAYVMAGETVSVCLTPDTEIVISSTLSGEFLRSEALTLDVNSKWSIVVYANKLGTSRVIVTGLGEGNGDGTYFGDAFDVANYDFYLGNDEGADQGDVIFSEPYDPDGVPPIVQRLDGLMREAKMAGVGLQTTWSSQLEENRFQLSSQSGVIETSSTKGLADEDQTTGGHLIGVIK